MRTAVIMTAFITSIFSVNMALASDYTVRPFLIHEVLEPRDIETREILITNDSPRLLRLYATVNEVSVDTEGRIEAFIPAVETDRTENITSWIEITRGRITIPPDTATSVPITFRINPQAEEGDYHAYIGFTDTNKRYVAEERALAGEALGLPVKISLAKEKLTDISVHRFHIPRFIFTDPRKIYELVLSNNGDVEESPGGEVIFYDSRGEEVGSLIINEDQDSVFPDEELGLAGSVSIPDKVGRYRANAIVRYGEGNMTTVSATTDFFYIPLWMLILLILAIVIFSLFVTYLLKRAMEDNMVVEHEEVDLFLRDNTGHTSEDKDHDIKIQK